METTGMLLKCRDAVEDDVTTGLYIRIVAMFVNFSSYDRYDRPSLTSHTAVMSARRTDRYRPNWGRCNAVSASKVLPVKGEGRARPLRDVVISTRSCRGSNPGMVTAIRTCKGEKAKNAWSPSVTSTDTWSCVATCCSINLSVKFAVETQGGPKISELIVVTPWS